MEATEKSAQVVDTLKYRAGVKSITLVRPVCVKVMSVTAVMVSDPAWDSRLTAPVSLYVGVIG